MHKVVSYARIGVMLVWLSLVAGQLLAKPPQQSTPSRPKLSQAKASKAKLKKPKLNPTRLSTTNLSKVESKFLADSGRQPSYPHEYFTVLEVRDPYELGKLTALRFIEWVSKNPYGVICLSTSSTSEHFIKFLYYYRVNWHKPKVQAELRGMGINGAHFPDTSNLRLVQLEEFYPLSAKHYQKASNFIMRNYVKILRLRKENLLLMDVTNRGILAEKGMKVVFMNGKIDPSIMNRKPNSQLEGWQQQAIRELRTFCVDYEKKIREWGGIDFLVGGISYWGHIGFNQPGSNLTTKTHLSNLDYHTAAHAAKDLGGIDYARGKIAITVGIGTITMKPNAIMIIMASGEAKTQVIRDIVEHKSTTKYPATMLQKFPNSRVYVAQSAAGLLTDRRMEDIKINSKQGWTPKLINDVIIEIALDQHKPILELKREDLEKHEHGSMLMQNPPKPLTAMLEDVRNSLITNIEEGVRIANLKSQRILHTGPHHDDIMLGYYPLIEQMGQHQNHFLYFTSGFNSVADLHIMSTINRASDWWINKEEDNIFNKPYDRTIKEFRRYFVNQDVEQMNMLDTTILLKHLVAVYNIKDVDQLKSTIRWLKDEYFPNKQAGDMNDTDNIKLLKGMMRESEADRLWSLRGIPLQNITHLRSKFYSGKEFLKTPNFEADVVPFIGVYDKFKPDILTVIDDPQSAPPVTHYRTLQIVTQALRYKNISDKDNLQILGYRNVWFRYRVQDANAYIPVQESMLEGQQRVFKSVFNTQKSASFPSPFFEGDFAALSNKIQREQLAELKQLLGEDYFANHPSADLRNAAGFIFMTKIPINELYQRVGDLQKPNELDQLYAKHVG